MNGKPLRGPRSDGAATRARILESAGTLFASQGLASTTSKAIAAKAEVDLASINYHFGNRDGLYRAVLVEAHRRFVRLEELERISASQVMPEEKLGTLLDAIVGRLAGPSHWSTAVLVRELAAPSAHFAVLRDEEAPPKLRVALRILSDVSGIPIGAPELLCCLISVAAPCAMLLVAGNNLPAPGRDILRINRRTLADHLHRFALAGLHAAGQDYRARHEEDHAQLPV